MTPQIGLDSHYLSYLIDIIGSASRTAEAVATEQLALIRIYFYTEVAFFVTPKVEMESMLIRDEEYRQLHESFMGTLFGVLPITDTDLIKIRARELTEFHSKEADCTVLAEAEHVKHDYLLTFDTKFVNRLSKHSIHVNLLSASHYWTALNIPKGSDPVTVPHSTNPLSEQNFWRW
jgi:hypothetical protein